MPLAENLAGLRLPVIVAPMFIVSGVDLVVSACRAGLVGSCPALNARAPDTLENWLCRIKDGIGTAGTPYAINLIMHSSNFRLAVDLETCLRHRVPILLTSMQAPGELVQAARADGALVFHDVTTRRHAEKAIERGVDGLVLVCAGAGGHTGSLSPFAFLQEVRRVFDGTIVLAGGITCGAGILAAQAMGADLVYIGTRFIATREANAADGYKQMIVDAGSADIVATRLISGANANYLRASLAAAGLDPDNLPQPEARAYAPASQRERPKAWRDIWGAGQGVADIDDIPGVAACVDRLEREYRQAWSGLLRLLPAGQPSLPADKKFP